MNEDLAASAIGGLRAQSSIAADVWYAEAPAGAYEWWYFDAVSSDGREALVVIFLAGFVFSPRFNRALLETLRGTREAPRGIDFPAVAIGLYRDGKPVVRVVQEYAAHDFAASEKRPLCRIGRNSFELKTTARGNVYDVRLEANLRGGRRISAALAWTVCAGDLLPNNEPDEGASAAATMHEWNLVAPRCNVSGTLCLINRNGQRTERHWQGVGYHDHNRDARPMFETIAEWQWGRAHFSDETIVFYRYRERTQTRHTTRLFITRDTNLIVQQPRYQASQPRRHIFGLRYPRVLEMLGDDEACFSHLRVEQQRVIDGSFFYLRFIGDAVFDAGDGRTQRAPLISEQLAPRALKWRALWWLTDMRIGKRGRAPFLP